MPSDIILFNSEATKSLAAQLMKLQDDLGEIAQKLDAITINQKELQEFICKFPTVSLRTTGDKITNSTMPLLIHRTSLALNNLSKYAKKLQTHVLKATDLYLDCERRLVSLIQNGEQAIPSNGFTKTNSSLQDMIKMLRSASPPDQLMAIRFYNFLMNNEIYKLFHNSLSMLTGNYSEMVNSIIYDFFRRATIL